jgi:hypothetical protein
VTQHTLYVFLIRRPQDKQAWPVVFSSNRAAAEAYPCRVSDVVEVIVTDNGDKAHE